MADYDSSLPVRTENNGDVAARIVDGTITSQALTVNADGSINITDNGGSLTVDAVDLDIRDLDQAQDSVAIGDGTDIVAVNADGSLNITDNGGSLTVDAVDLDIRDLDQAQDSVAIGDGTDIIAINGDGSINITDNGGSITVDGTVAVSNFPATVDTNYGTVGASTIRTAAQIGNATGAADFNNGATGAQTLRVAANLAVAGANVSASNPVPVSVVDATPGTPINDYNTVAAVAGGASSNHDYTVTALNTLHLNQIEASASGKMKIEVQVETGVATGVFTSRFVQFNSTAETNMSIHIENPIAVAAGVRVRVIRTNRDNQAQDVYSTISGYELT